MLANGATLQYKEHGAAGNYTDLPGLKEIPEIGADPEKVENTVLTDTVKKYEIGIGDPGDMTYKFKYVNTAATDSYRLLRAAQATGNLYDFKETDKDGTTVTFSAYPSVKRGGGGVNGVIDFDLNCVLASEITITNPAAQETE